MSTGPEQAQIVSDNWRRVRDEVEQACHRAGRPPSDVTILGVTKYVDATLAGMLFDAGCKDLGENRPQEMWHKAEWFAQRSGANNDDARAGQPRWHLIGHMQRNKVRRSLGWIHLLHSLDSRRLAEALAAEADRVNRVLPCLIEVNITQDTTKTGIPSSELESLTEYLLGQPSLQLVGLMAMASHAASGDRARREFAQVRSLRDRLQEHYSIDLPHLSMGMSGDFAEAIMEGATLVRIGSSLWQGVRGQG